MDQGVLVLYRATQHAPADAKRNSCRSSGQNVLEHVSAVISVANHIVLALRTASQCLQWMTETRL